MIDKLIKVATLVSVVTYLFWSYLPKGSYYIGNALFIFLLCLIIYYKSKPSLTTFFLLCISVSNLVDELLFDPQKISYNELFFAILIPFVYYARKNHKHRLLRFFN